MVTYLFPMNIHMTFLLSIIEMKNTEDILNKVHNNIIEFDRTHTDEYNCNYLYIKSKINENIIETNLYNKIDSYNFKITDSPMLLPSFRARLRPPQCTLER